MTQEQLDIIRSILEDYDKLANIASNMNWAKTETKCIDTDRMNLKAIASFISLRFEKEYVQEHFPEAVTQAMIGYICQNAVYDYKISKYRDYELSDDIKAMLAYFSDVKLSRSAKAVMAVTVKQIG